LPRAICPGDTASLDVPRRGDQPSWTVNGGWSNRVHPPFASGFNARARSELARRRQKRPLLRQQFLKRRVDPHGHKSLSPSRSTSSTSPSRIVRASRFTRVSDGKPLRRLLIGSKGEMTPLDLSSLVAWVPPCAHLLSWSEALGLRRAAQKDYRPAATGTSAHGRSGAFGRGARDSPRAGWCRACRGRLRLRPRDAPSDAIAYPIPNEGTRARRTRSGHRRRAGFCARWKERADQSLPTGRTPGGQSPYRTAMGAEREARPHTRARPSGSTKTASSQSNQSPQSSRSSRAAAPSQGKRRG
jgi:hypothetical protein